MARAFKVTASAAALLGASLIVVPSCGSSSNNTRAQLETPEPPPTPSEQPGSDVPPSGTGTGPASFGSGSNSEGPSSSNDAAKDKDQNPRARTSCVEFASCGVDKPCVTGLHCVRIDGCMSALCMTPEAACQVSCNKNDCSIMESYPAQVSCSGGPGEPPAPEPDVIADSERSPR